MYHFLFVHVHCSSPRTSKCNPLLLSHDTMYVVRLCELRNCISFFLSFVGGGSCRGLRTNSQIPSVHHSNDSITAVASSYHYERHPQSKCAILLVHGIHLKCTFHSSSQHRLTTYRAPCYRSTLVAGTLRL